MPITIQESKIISLDLGNNFSKFETFIDGTDEIYSGLTLHEKDGDPNLVQHSTAGPAADWGE